MVPVPLIDPAPSVIGDVVMATALPVLVPTVTLFEAALNKPLTNMALAVIVLPFAIEIPLVATQDPSESTVVVSPSFTPFS